MRVKCCDCGEEGGNHAGIIHWQHKGDSPGNDAAVLIAPFHVTLIHSVQNVANGSMPSFVCMCLCVKVCVQQ